MESNFKIQALAVGPIRANCYILSLKGRDDCVLIDPGAQPERILAAASGKRIAAVLLTHGHFDHIGGVMGVLAPDTVLYIHGLDEPLLCDPSRNMATMIGQELVVSAAAVPVKESEVISAAGMLLQRFQQIF
jgi:glyoxylase-like metal-dependent hydrolase (beta-lactamase superfamily II)